MGAINIEQLRDGRKMGVVKVSCPAPERIDEFSSLLGHKGEPWIWHLKECLSGGTPGLDTHFYLAEVGGRFVGNVAMFQNGDMGNISHVFTHPEFRGQGIAKLLMRAAMADLENSKGRIIVLGTGFQSMPWKLYESLGFHGVCPEQSYGGMFRFLGGSSWTDLLSGSAGTVCRADWQHFVGLQVLFAVPNPTQLRSVLFPSIGPRLVEEQFIRLKWRQQSGDQTEAAVIEGPGACVLGCALMGQHPLWGTQCRRRILDLHFASAGAGKVPELVQAVLDKVMAPVECYCDALSEEKIAVLKQYGFREESRVASYFHFGEAVTGLVVMVRD